MLNTLTGLVSTYGDWLVFGLIALEGLGLPLPGETMLIVAGAYAAFVVFSWLWAATP